MRHSPQNSELREIGLSSENQTMKSMCGGSEKGEAKSPHRGRVAPAPSLIPKWRDCINTPRERICP